MIPTLLDSRLHDDSRAVAPLVGAILLLGFLVIGLSLYQAQIVPQQNSETEFEHFEDTQNELIELSDDISMVGEFNRARYPTVKLGTNYQTRTIAINSPPPAGLIQTSDAYPINISNGGELKAQPQTRFIEYRPGYNELDIGSTWYEHSLLYLDDRENGGGISVIQDQELVDNGQVTITALQNPFEETGTSRLTIEIYPKNDFTESDIPDEGELNVTVPTRLDADEYWNQTLEDAGDTYQGVNDSAHKENEIHAIELIVDAEDLQVNTVGIQTAPDENQVANIITSTDENGETGITELPPEADEGSGEYFNNNFDSNVMWDEDDLIGDDGEVEYDEEDESLSLFTAGDVDVDDMEFDELGNDLRVFTVGDVTASEIEVDEPDGEVLFETGGDVDVDDMVFDELGDDLGVFTDGDVTTNEIEVDESDGDVLFYTQGDFTVEEELKIEEVEGDIHIYVGGEVDIGDIDFDDNDGDVILYDDTDYGDLENEEDRREPDLEEFPQ